MLRPLSCLKKKLCYCIFSIIYFSWEGAHNAGVERTSVTPRFGKGFINISQIITFYNSKLNEIIYENPLAQWLLLRKHSLKSIISPKLFHILSHSSSRWIRLQLICYLKISNSQVFDTWRISKPASLQKNEMRLFFKQQYPKSPQEGSASHSRRYQRGRWVAGNFWFWSKSIMPSIRPIFKILQVIRCIVKKIKQGNATDNDSRRNSLMGTLTV